MSLYTSFVSKVLFPLHERLKKHSTIAVHKQMEATQWQTPEQLEVLRIARLRAFLQRIGQDVPYYRDLFAKLSFNPETVTSLEDIRQLPLMGKPDIRAHAEAMKADNAVGLARFNTGGSSGAPLIFYIGKERVSHDVAAKRRATRWWGVDLGDPEIVVWGSPIELGAQDRVRIIRDKLFRTELLSAFEMTEDNLNHFVASIRKARPKMLFAYPSSLSHIAKHAKQKGVAMDDLGVKVAFVTSERLYDEQRAMIESVFGCPVANGYGGRDAGFIAHQCPQGNMHITADDLLVEIVDKEGNVLPAGESGEIVVTHFATGDFPFVRYRTGDVGVLDDSLCDCGRSLPLLKEIQGRTTDFVVAKNGAVIHGLALIYILRDLPGIAEFKVVQESLDLTRVMIVKAQGYVDSNEQAISEVFQQRLGEGVQVEFEYSDVIPAEKSGKFRYIISKVAV